MNWVLNRNTNDKLTSTHKLVPICGAKDFRWKLQMCRRNEGRLGGSDHVQLEGLVGWKGEKVLHVHDQGGLGKCRVGASHSHKGLGVDKGTSGWCVVC
jgi:hypothetical protein